MLRKFKDFYPQVGECYIDETAIIIGKVVLGKDSSVFPYAVLRGDDNAITVGTRTNIQDQVTIHVSTQLPTFIGDDVNIGHGAILHGCSIGNSVLIGMHATVLDGAIIEDHCIVAAGSVCPPNKRYPANSMIMGSPAKVVRPLTQDEIDGITRNANHYVELASTYRSYNKT